MNIKTYWDKNNNPIDTSMSDVIYQLRREDGHHKLMFDSLNVADILENERVISMDSLTSLFSKLEPRMTALMRVMERNAVNIKPISMTITDPFKRNGSLQVGVIFELSDGQSITVFFHNPDVDKKSIKGTDTLTSWKWLLNKKDITILVAPERGKDIVLKDVAIRMMKIAEKNAKTFEKNNKNKAERAKQIDGLKTEITGLESELKGLESDLEAAKINKEEQTSSPAPIEKETKGNKEQQNPIDPIAEENIQQAGLSKALSNKVTNHLMDNPESKTLPSPKALKIIGENTIRALGAELEGNGFEKKGANEWSNDSFKTTISVVKDKKASTGYKIIINGNSAVSLDATKTINEAKLWDGALPFDLDVKAFVADIVLNMSVVDDEPLIEEISTPIEAPSEDGEVIKEDEGMIEKLAQEPDEKIEDISKDEKADDAVAPEPEPTFKSLDQEEEAAILETIPLNADQEGTFNVNIISVGRKWIKANFDGKSFNIQIAINPVSKNWKAGDKVSFFGKKHVKKNKYATVTTLYPVRGDDKIKEQRSKIQKINDGTYGDLTIKGTESGYDITFDYDEDIIDSLKELIPEDLRSYSNKVWFVDTLATDKLVEFINKFDSGESTQDEVEPEGDSNEVKTSKGDKVMTGFSVIEASKLVASHDAQGDINPNYPADLQPRDRTRTTSKAWVLKTAKNLDTGSLGKSNRADSGAPIVGKDLIVESGNGRVMAITEAYRMGTADEYKQWVTDNAKSFGLDKQKVEAMKRPVLVRIRTSELDRVAFAVDANQDDKLSMTATEKASSDAKLLKPELIANLSEDSDLLSMGNRKFLVDFVHSLGDTEAAQYMTSSGEPTASLIARVQSAIFSKAYNNERLLELTADSAKPEIANILKGLNEAATEFIVASEYDEDAHNSTVNGIVRGIDASLNEQATNSIIEAISSLKKAEQQGLSIDDFINQGDMFGDISPEVAIMAKFIKDNNRSSKKLGEAFKMIASYIKDENKKKQTNDLFGDNHVSSLKEVIGAVDKELKKENGKGLIEETPLPEPLPTSKTTDFINELDGLMNEDDPKLLGDKLDVIADRIEEVGLMDELEPKLNEVADRITLLLKEIEDNSEVA